MAVPLPEYVGDEATAFQSDALRIHLIRKRDDRIAKSRYVRAERSDLPHSTSAAPHVDTVQSAQECVTVLRQELNQLCHDRRLPGMTVLHEQAMDVLQRCEHGGHINQTIIGPERHTASDAESMIGSMRIDSLRE